MTSATLGICICNLTCFCSHGSSGHPPSAREGRVERESWGPGWTYFSVYAELLLPGPISRTEGASVWHGVPGWVLTNVGLLSVDGKAGAPIRTKRAQRTESSPENSRPAPRKPKEGVPSLVSHVCMTLRNKMSF